MKKANLSKDFVLEEVKCNQLSFITFLEQYGTEVSEINGYVTNGKYRKEQKSSTKMRINGCKQNLNHVK